MGDQFGGSPRCRTRRSRPDCDLPHRARCEPSGWRNVMDRAVHVGVASGADELVARQPRAEAEPEISVRRWAALGLLCLGAFLVVLDTTIVNIAIPNILSSLR